MSENKKRQLDFDTWFDRFPIEILLVIFQYLSSTDIFYSFGNFNQRFNNLLIQPYHFSRTLELPTLNFDYWKPILSLIGSQIET
jgi:hypothetical protein